MVEGDMLVPPPDAVTPLAHAAARRKGCRNEHFTNCDQFVECKYLTGYGYTVHVDEQGEMTTT
jgi:hypothetical protein